MKPTSIATLALIALTGSASAATFLGGAIETATNWTANTLPSLGNVGTVAVDGTAGVAAATFGFGAGAVVTQTAGTITGAMNMLSGTWNLQDGALTGGSFKSNGSATVLNLFGGTVTATADVGTANGSSMTVGGDVVITSGQLQLHGGSLNFTSDWTGSWNTSSFLYANSATSWETLFTSNTANVTYDGSPITTTAEFNAAFTVTGTTLTAITLSLTWDTVSGDGSSVTWDSGTWDTSTTNWNDGNGSVAWVNSAQIDAVFPASSQKTITIGTSSLIANTVSFTGASNTILIGTYENLTATQLAVNIIGSGKLVLSQSGALSNVQSFLIGNETTIYMTEGHIIDSAVTLSGNGNSESRGALRVDNNSRVQGTITLTADSTFGSSAGTGYIESTISGDFAFNQAAISANIISISGDNTYTGGSTIGTGTVQAGHNNAFGTGQLKLSGGTFSSDSTTARDLSNPILIDSSVTLGNSTNNGKITFSGASTISGATVNTDSGVEFQQLTISGNIQHGGTGSLVLAGTVQTQADGTSLGGSAITIHSNGITIDTNGHDTIISAPLAGAGDIIKTGLGKLIVSSPSSTFTGTIQVNQGTLEFAPNQSLPDSLSIMPLGDSITYGYGGPGGYRLPLYNLLTPINSTFQFVGDSTENPDVLPVNQQAHAGHGSYTSVNILNNLNGLDTQQFVLHGGVSRDPHGGYWLTGGNGTGRAPLFPDIVLLLAGTNDVNQLASGISSYVALYTDLMNEITTLRPDAHVFMAKITPRSSFHQNTDDYNQAIEQVYNTFQAAGHDVTLVDLYNGYTGGWVDGVHPNAAAYNWMATQWYNAIVATFGIDEDLDLSQIPTITIGSGATLSGSGQIDAISVQGSLSPGDDGVGTFTAGNSTLSGTYNCDLGADTSDHVVVAGDLTLTGTTLTINSLQAAATMTYPIVSYTGTLTGSFTAASGIPAGYSLVHDTVNQRFIVTTHYGAWRASNGLVDEAEVTASDHDQDGDTDYAEFATGGDPANGQEKGIRQGGIHEITGNESYAFTFAVFSGAAFTAGVDNAMSATVQDVTYRVENSPNLVDWDGELSEITPVTTGLPTTPVGYTYHSFKAPSNPSLLTQSFMRLTMSPSN